MCGSNVAARIIIYFSVFFLKRRRHGKWKEGVWAAKVRWEGRHQSKAKLQAQTASHATWSSVVCLETERSTCHWPKTRGRCSKLTNKEKKGKLNKAPPLPPEQEQLRSPNSFLPQLEGMRLPAPSLWKATE